VPEREVSAGLQRLSLVPAATDAVALAALLCDGRGGSTWTLWENFFTQVCAYYIDR